MARYDDLNTGRILFVGVISVMLTFVVILGLQVVYFAMQDTADQRKLLTTEYVSSDEYLASQQEQLQAEPTVVTSESSRAIHIPIDAAMTIVADEMAAVDAESDGSAGELSGGEADATVDQT